MANDYNSTSNNVVTPPAVQPVVVVQPATAAPPPAVLGVTQTAPVKSSGSLPFTGGDVAGLVVIGVVLLGGGTILVRRNRAASAS
jgi:LPXTG-motif cell wall-anchored protein